MKGVDVVCPALWPYHQFVGIFISALLLFETQLSIYGSLTLETIVEVVSATMFTVAVNVAAVLLPRQAGAS